MVGTWVQQTAWGIVNYLLDSLMRELADQVWGWFGQLFGVPLSVLNDPTVAILVHVTVGLVIGFLPVAIAWMVVKETAARLDGTATTAPEALIRRAMVTAVAVTGTSTLAWFMLMIADYARQILVGIGVDINPLQVFFSAAPGSGLITIVLLLLFLIGGIVLLVQRAVIMAETTVMLAIGPLMAVGLLREGGGTSWNIWLRELTSLLVTGLIQMLVTLMFLRKFAGGDLSLGVNPLNAQASLDMFQRMAALGYLWVLWNAPRWARQMVYSVGTGGALLGGAASMTRMVVMRQIFTAMAAA